MAQVEKEEFKDYIRCLVVDDNPVARITLRYFIEKNKRLTLAGECANGNDAQKAMENTVIDLIFLDVEMPDMTGLELLERVNKKPAVVFTTVGRQYAANAFDVQAIDFLLKPIEYERFCLAVEKAEKYLALSKLEKVEKEEMVLLQDGKTIVQVNINSINRVEALGDYAKVFTDLRQFTLHTTMKILLEKLQPYGFERVHRSHIVKISTIQKIKTKSLVTYSGEIPVSANYREDLIKKLANVTAII
jgi:DNA-binding LytR/AlgR family response regulator